MKSITLFAAVALAATAVAGSASANHFEPKGVAYKAAGSFVIAIASADACQAVFRGNTDAGQGASITSVTFKQPCGLIADGLPWRMATHAADSLTIYGMSFHHIGNATMCAEDAKAQLTSLGHIVFSTELEVGFCALSGTLITRPQLSSVGK